MSMRNEYGDYDPHEGYSAVEVSMDAEILGAQIRGASVEDEISRYCEHVEYDQAVRAVFEKHFGPVEMVEDPLDLPF